MNNINTIFTTIDNGPTLTPIVVISPSTYILHSTLNTFTFSGTFSTGDDIVNWRWDFGDASNNSTQSVATHSYNNYGLYDAYLYVDDGVYPSKRNKIEITCQTYSMALNSTKYFAIIGETIDISVTSVIGSPNSVDQVYYEFSDGVIQTNSYSDIISHIFNTSGTYSISGEIVDTNLSHPPKYELGKYINVIVTEITFNMHIFIKQLDSPIVSINILSPYQLEDDFDCQIDFGDGYVDILNSSSFPIIYNSYLYNTTFVYLTRYRFKYSSIGQYCDWITSPNSVYVIDPLITTDNSIIFQFQSVNITIDVMTAIPVPIDYEVDFGDGSTNLQSDYTLSGPISVPSHQYLSLGTFDVRVKIKLTSDSSWTNYTFGTSPCNITVILP
jgi:hypothetical protein